jgi:hypothetical protein
MTISATMVSNHQGPADALVSTGMRDLEYRYPIIPECMAHSFLPRLLAPLYQVSSRRI